MKVKNLLLVITVITIISFLSVLMLDLSNMDEQDQANQQINQSEVLPSQPGPMRPGDRVIRVPLSGVLLTVALILLAFYFVYGFVEQDFSRKLTVLSNIANEQQISTSNLTPQTTNTTFLKLLNPNERKIIDKLIENRGVALQSEISRMDEMGKVKAHRYLQKLSQMGVVKIERHGNTNKIVLSEDIKKILIK